MYQTKGWPDVRQTNSYMFMLSEGEIKSTEESEQNIDIAKCSYCSLFVLSHIELADF